MPSPQSILLISGLLALIPSAALTQTSGSKYQRPKIANPDPYANSDILVDKKTHTILPKHCILYIPKKLHAHSITSPQKNFTIWPKFYSQNTIWLHRLEVTLDQAKGLKPINPEKLEKIKQLGKIIVAVRHQNPISVLPPRQGPSVKKQ